MDGRIEQLTLKVRAPADCLVRIGPAARDFATRVLQRCDALLAERAPGRIILMRRLDMTWRLLESALTHEGEAEAFADEMATALATQAGTAASPPSSEQDLVVFQDEADWRAAHLAARAAGPPSGAWYFARLEEEGEPPGRLRDAERRAVAEAVLIRLAAGGALAQVLAMLPSAGLDDLARNVGIPGPPGGDASVRPQASALVRSHLLAAIRARRGGAPEAASGPPIKTSCTPADTPGSPAPAPMQTRFGGLFYLLARCVELSLGDVLWQACLPEGAVLTHATAALLAPAASGDAAPAMFGGVAAETPVPPVSPDQHAEIATALVVSLGAALPRRGLAVLPETVLGLTGHVSGRLLVVAVPGSPFALFAWPAPSARATAAGIRAFLAGWPPGAPPVRSVPELAELDRSGRLRSSRGATLSRHLILPEGASAEASALLAQVAGVMCSLFAARAGAMALLTPTEFADEFLALPGRLELAPESMTVFLPMARIDLRVRRAGLDVDPGWVPWLGRPVRIVFQEDEAGESPSAGAG